MEYRGEGWGKVRDYAMGRQDIGKFKELINGGKRNSYVKFSEWDRLAKRVLKKFRRKVKTRNFIWRLKLISYKK